MKRLFFCTVFFLFSLTSFCGKFAFYYDGYWGPWKGYICSMGFDENSLYFYKPWDHPSENFLKIRVNTSSEPEKDGKWYVYSGTVEYYVSEEYPTIKDVLKHGFFVQPYDSPPIAKRTATATITMHKRLWRKHPRLLTVFFDDIAIAIGIS